MKKFLVLFFVAFYFASFSFSVVSNKEISDLILKNQKINRLVSNDLIYPGDYLFFNLEDDMVSITIKKGDCLWNIAERVLIDYKKSKKQIVNAAPIPLIVKKPFIPEKKTPLQVLDKNTSGVPNWLWVVICFLLALFSMMADKCEKKGLK